MEEVFPFAPSYNYLSVIWLTHIFAMSCGIKEPCSVHSIVLFVVAENAEVFPFLILGCRSIWEV